MPDPPHKSSVPLSEVSRCESTYGGSMSLRSSRAESPWAIRITVFAAAMLITCQAAAARS